MKDRAPFIVQAIDPLARKKVGPSLHLCRRAIADFSVDPPKSLLAEMSQRVVMRLVRCWL